ncbi:MAG: ribokinase [Vicinamibacterales bacterium]
MVSGSMAGVLVIGSSNTDLVCYAPRIPVPGETIAGHSFQTFAGGKGANQAVAAARAGAHVVFVGACGDDDYGAARRADLVAEGIDTSSFRVVAGATSGVAAIVVDDRGENQIVYVPGANATISPDDVARPIAASNYRVVSLTFEIPFETVASAIRHRRDETLVVLNAAPYDERLAELLPVIDVLVCNEIEASALLGDIVSRANAERAARKLADQGSRCVVLTLGPDGAVAADESGVWWTGVPVVTVVDTTGAGDAFCGALAAWLAKGQQLREAVRAGVAAGSLAVTCEGAQPSSPNQAQIHQMLATMNGS